MNKLLHSRSSTAARLILGSMALLAFLVCAQPQTAQATTSGGATIYNTVKVTYLSGATSFFTTASVSVTVNTVAALPTVTNPNPQTVNGGAVVNYIYSVKSNSNGTDTYTTSALANTPDANIGAATAASVTASIQLWGGIVVGSGAGFITVPFGSTTGLVAGTSTVQIGANTYTVTTITPGSAAATNAGTGNLTAEVPTTLVLTPIGASAAVTAGNAPAGTQVGEFKSTSLTAAFTAATPTASGTDGHYNTHYTVATGALPVALTLTTTDVTTTVSSPRVTITKTANVGTASPGDTIIYTITVTNTHPTAAASSVTVIDPIPAYTAYVANSTRLNGITVNGDGATSPLIAGLLVDSNGSRAAGTVATGTLAAGQVATIIFNVTVQ